MGHNDVKPRSSSHPSTILSSYPLIPNKPVQTTNLTQEFQMLPVPEPLYPVMCPSPHVPCHVPHILSCATKLRVPKLRVLKLRVPSRALISCHVPQNCGAPICQIVAPAQFSWTSHVSAQCCCCNKQRTEQENLCDLKSFCCNRQCTEQNSRLL